MAQRYLQQTAHIDLDSPRVNSAGGIHIAAMGGLWMAVMMGFVGLGPLGEELALDPVLPEAWQALTFRLQWRGRLVRLRIDARRRVVAATLERGDALTLRVSRETMRLDGATERECPY